MQADFDTHRYLVFMSSTYEDLKDEREQVLRAILEMRAFPDGMESFPATNETQWQFIKREIEICDFFIIVVAGKYGSIAPEGISYTEMEYDYAMQLKKPVLAFLHADPDSLRGHVLERDVKKRKKLDAFREKVKKSRIVKFFTTPQELKSQTLNALSHSFTSKPAEGWVRSGTAQHIEGGLSEYRETFRGLSYEKMFRESSSVYIVLNDGRGWIDSNRDLLEMRAGVKNQTTCVLTLHPQSDFLKVLIRKNGKRMEAQIDEIRRTYRVIKDITRKFGPGFDIRGHSGFNPYSLFLGDENAYVMPYFLNEAGQLPVCVFNNTTAENCLYQRYKDDATQMFQRAQPLHDTDFPSHS